MIAQEDDFKNNFKQNSNGAVSSLLFIVFYCSSPSFTHQTHDTTQKWNGDAQEELTASLLHGLTAGIAQDLINIR